MGLGLDATHVVRLVNPYQSMTKLKHVVSQRDNDAGEDQTVSKATLATNATTSLTTGLLRFST